MSLDGIGDIHNEVRHVKRGFDKACQTIEAMQALAASTRTSRSASPSTIFATNLDDAKNILAWARTKKLDVVFNMLRFTDNMLGNRDLEETIGFERARRRIHAPVLPRARPGGIGPLAARRSCTCTTPT